MVLPPLAFPVHSCLQHATPLSLLHPSRSFTILHGNLFKITLSSMDNRISISSLDTPQQIFVFACMDEPLLTRMAETFPEWRALINPIRVQKRYLSQFLDDLEFALLRMSRGKTVQETEARLGDAVISERLQNAFSKLTRPEIPYNPEIPPMTYDYIEEYIEAARAVMEAASIQARTVYRRERELIASAYGFRVGKILETLVGDESEAYQNRSAAYMEIERAIRFVLERMLPRETFAGFRARNSAAAEACSIVASLIENQHNVRPWINRFNLEGMDIECFDLLLRRLQVEKWETDVLEDLIREAGHHEVDL